MQLGACWIIVCLTIKCVYPTARDIAQAALSRALLNESSRGNLYIWWQQWDPSLTVVQGDPWIQKSMMELIEVDLRRKSGSVSKSGRPEGSRLEREG